MEWMCEHSSKILILNRNTETRFSRTNSTGIETYILSLNSNVNIRIANMYFSILICTKLSIVQRHKDYLAGHLTATRDALVGIGSCT
jgi:hypothetical protein